MPSTLDNLVELPLYSSFSHPRNAPFLLKDVGHGNVIKAEETVV
jgi:hypothetical protein